MMPIETERLAIRELTIEDAPFMHGLLNEPSFLRFIGDRGVRSLDDARDYLRRAALADSAAAGLGPFLVSLLERDTSIGICSLLRRDWLDDVDLGFAFLPAYWGGGYAFEAASATMAYARGELGVDRIVAITALENARAERLLERLGLRFDRIVPMPPDDELLRLFTT